MKNINLNLYVHAYIEKMYSNHSIIHKKWKIIKCTVRIDALLENK